MPEPSTRELKRRAQLTKASVRLGKAGATPEFIAELDQRLSLSELVKVRFEGFKEERKELSVTIAEKTGSRLIQQVGHTAVYYRNRETSVKAPL